MKSPISSGFRLTPRAAWRGLFCIALVASTAHACPPGTTPDPNYDPSSPTARAHPQRCVPAPKPPVAKYDGVTNPNAEHAARLHSPTPMQADRSKLKPQPGAPIERTNGAADTHGILFVGGNNATGSQRPSSGKAALNPQPIPPGHAPRPNDPVEKAGGH